MSHVLRLVNDKGGRIHAISKKAMAKSIQLSSGDRFQLGRISEPLRTIKFEMYPFLANNQQIKNEAGKKNTVKGAPQKLAKSTPNSLSFWDCNQT